jgi:hypothetical protein
MANCINSAMKRVQAPDLDAEIDRVVAKAERDQLKASDDPVLATSESRNERVENTRATFAVYIPVNVARVGHAAILAARA